MSTRSKLLSSAATRSPVADGREGELENTWTINEHQPREYRHLRTSGRLIRLPQIIGPDGYLPVSRSHFYELIKAGEIPPPIKLGPRISVWRESDILDFIEKKAQG